MNKKLFQLFILILPLTFLVSCEKEEDKAGQIAGLWIQEKLTEDGQEIALPAEQQSLRLFFETNGVYRTYAKDMPADNEHFGAWTVTDNTWLELTIDTWHLANAPLDQSPDKQWIKSHIPQRFTILALSDNVLEIRIKAFIGDKKYAAMFVENAALRTVVTSDNLEIIQQEYRDTKTYIFTFKKATI